LNKYNNKPIHSGDKASQFNVFTKNKVHKSSGKPEAAKDTTIISERAKNLAA